MRRALNTWVLLRERRMIVVRAIRALSLRSERVGFNSWLDASRALLEMHGKLARALAALSPKGRAKRRALNSWLRLAKDRSTMARAMRALTRRGERLGFNAWCSAVEARAEQRRILTRALLAMRYRGRRACFNGWLAFAEAVRAHHRRLRQSLSAWFGGSLHRAWSSWVSATARRLRVAEATVVGRRHVRAERRRREERRLPRRLRPAAALAVAVEVEHPRAAGGARRVGTGEPQAQSAGLALQPVRLGARLILGQLEQL